MSKGIEWHGVQQTLRALKQIEPDLERFIRKAINTAIGKIRTLARGYIPAESPMSGWTPNSWGHRGWDTASARAGIQRKNDSFRDGIHGWVRSVDIANMSAPGMIYELAGSKSSGRGSGRQFIRNIAEEPGSLRTPLRRIVVRAGIEQGPATRESIQKSANAAAALTQQKIPVIRG